MKIFENEKWDLICDFCKKQNNNIVSFYADEFSIKRTPTELDICEDCLKKLTGFPVEIGGEQDEKTD